MIRVITDQKDACYACSACKCVMFYRLVSMLYRCAPPYECIDHGKNLSLTLVDQLRKELDGKFYCKCYLRLGMKCYIR